jgi:hypothetical protein
MEEPGPVQIQTKALSSRKQIAQRIWLYTFEWRDRIRILVGF